MLRQLGIHQLRIHQLGIRHLLDNLLLVERVESLLGQILGPAGGAAETLDLKETVGLTLLRRLALHELLKQLSSPEARGRGSMMSEHDERAATSVSGRPDRADQSLSERPPVPGPPVPGPMARSPLVRTEEGGGGGGSAHLSTCFTSFLTCSVSSAAPPVTGDVCSRHRKTPRATSALPLVFSSTHAEISASGFPPSRSPTCRAWDSEQR